MNRTIAVIALVCLTIGITATSCSTKRPYMCHCTNDSMGTTYNIDVKTRAEADNRCAQYANQGGWNSCNIMLHE